MSALLSVAPVHAQIDVRTLNAARAGAPARLTTRAPMGVADRDAFDAIVELPPGEDPRLYGLPLIGSRFSAVHAPLADLARMAKVHPSWRVTWSPPLHPLLDKAAQWIHAPEYRNETGFTGKDVVVGIVDTGVDLQHADLRNADGTTRVAYVIDFSKTALGIYPDAESRCTDAGLKCAVFGRAEIDDALSRNDATELPVDTFGHGTHVASLAAGNGGAEKKYVGSAPESTLIVARVASGSGDIGDSSVLVGTKLVFELAEAEGKSRGRDRLPAVVNLSLGSDFGAHDGTAALERGLADLVGEDHPGRSIVVAAGNSAGLATGNADFPQPLGVHAEVHVPDGPAVRVPLVTSPATPQATLSAAMYVWIAHRPGDDLRVGVDTKDGNFIAPQPQGTSDTFGSGDAVSVTIINGPLAEVGLGDDGAGAVVVIEGTWPSDQTYAIRLEGHGTANLWVQSGGDLSPGTGALGARFPAAFKDSTVMIPASSASLIAVGATVNRVEWSDRVDNPIVIETFGSATTNFLDGVAFFSSAGPTADQRMKPDLLAPGAFVAGAMSRDADPGRNPAGMFGESGLCRPVTDCTAIDATHGVAIGTSMAAPIVAGSVALLLEGDPELTQDRLLTLLQAGARHPSGNVPVASQMGAGVLNLVATLDAQRLVDAPAKREPSETASFLSFAQGFAHPDPTWDLPVILMLRDDAGNIADATEARDLDLDLAHGRVTKDVEKVAPGFFRFTVAADRDTGGAALEVEVYAGGARLASERLPIGVDLNVVQSGFAAQGGCAVSRLPSTNGANAFALAALGLTAWSGKRRRSAVRTARNRGRTDTSG